MKIYNHHENSLVQWKTLIREHSMSELHDEIQNLSAVLELLQNGARHGQRPVLRLASSHLRLLARTLDHDGEDAMDAASPARGGAALPPAVAEVCHVRQ